MISALHLIWIIPLSAYFGYALCAIFTVGKRSDQRRDDYGNFKDS